MTAVETHKSSNWLYTICADAFLQYPTFFLSSFFQTLFCACIRLQAAKVMCQIFAYLFANMFFSLDKALLFHL